MKNKTSIIALTIVLLGLGGLATWDEWKTKQEDKEKETKGLISPLKSTDVVSIETESTPDDDQGNKAPGINKTPDGHPHIKLSLKDGKWYITSPVEALADQQTVADFLKNVTEYKYDSIVSSSRDQWGAFGLNSPRRLINFVSNSGSKFTFLVGINTPVGFNVYSARGDRNEVYVGSQYITTSTLKSLFDFRDKQLFTTRPYDVKYLAAKIKSGSYRIEKDQESWSIVAPTPVPADSIAVTNLISDLVNVKAAEFLDKPERKILDAFANENPWAYFEIGAKKESAERFKIIERSGKFFGKFESSATVFALSDDIKAKLLKTPSDLKDKKIFSFKASEVNSIRIDGEMFRKVGDDWYSDTDANKANDKGQFAGSDKDKPTPKANIRSLLVDLEFAKAEEIIESSASIQKQVSQPPKHKVTVSVEKKPAETKIEIWMVAEDNDLALLKLNDSQKVFKVKRSLISSLESPTSVPVGDEALAPHGPN